MEDYAYVIETFSASLAVDVRLNDWPAFRALDGVGLAAQQKVNPWLIEGDNRIEVKVAPVDIESDMAPMLSLKLYKTEHGQRTKEEDILLYFRWTASEYPLFDEGMTRVCDHTITFVNAYGRWGWERAKPFLPSDRPDIESLVASFHNALQRKDIPALVNMLRMKNEEVARSLGQDPADMEVKQRSYFTELYFSEPTWQLDSLDASALEMESSAGGRLVAVTGPGGQAPLSGSTAPHSFAHHLTVSHIDGTWLIVR